MRLDKYLAYTGYGTRSVTKKLILGKKVSVNGVITTKDDYKVDESKDIITVNGKKAIYQEFIYLMLNKPAGVITANKDTHQKTTYDLIQDVTHLETFPVGRLDKDTEGLLIITNDGGLSHQLLSPKYHVDKTYYVEFSGTYKAIYTSLFETGITLEDGYMTMPSTIELLSSNSCNLTIKEGKYHQVKRMFIALDMEVTYLKRVSFGPIHLDETLQKGAYRTLTETEIEALKEIPNKY